MSFGFQTQRVIRIFPRSGEPYDLAIPSHRESPRTAALWRYRSVRRKVKAIRRDLRLLSEFLLGVVGAVATRLWWDVIILLRLLRGRRPRRHVIVSESVARLATVVLLGVLFFAWFSAAGGAIGGGSLASASPSSGGHPQPQVQPAPLEETQHPDATLTTPNPVRESPEAPQQEISSSQPPSSAGRSLSAIRRPAEPGLRQISSGQPAASLGSSDAAGTWVARDALPYIGIPYVWGGEDPWRGFDCSGLIYRILQDRGFDDIPRRAGEQRGLGYEVPPDHVNPGDLLFFDNPSHVGIYIGDRRMVHASSTNGRVTVQRLDRGYLRRLAEIRRIPLHSRAQTGDFSPSL